MSRIPLRLQPLFVVASLVITGLLGWLSVLVFQISREVISLQAVQSLKDETVLVRRQLRQFLSQPAEVVKRFEQDVALGLTDPKSCSQVEAFLFRSMVERPDLIEATVTYPDGNQLSVFREQEEVLVTYSVAPEGARFDEMVRRRPAGGGLQAGAFEPGGEVSSPTESYTYSTPARDGVSRWTDIHDRARGESEPRVVFSALKPFFLGGELGGVMRVTISTRRINREVATVRPEYRVFLCDQEGRLIAPPGEVSEPREMVTSSATRLEATRSFRRPP